MAKSSFRYLAAAAVVFVGTVAFVGPSGDFPLNDDWAYAIATRTLVATGAWRPNGWFSMPAISNALWAAPICAASSCSFGALRLTTLLASLLLLSGTFLLIRPSHKESPVPLVATVLVVFNPIAYTLSFTFMTDILFSTLITASALLFISSLKQGSVLPVVLGTIVALAATLSRQLGLCVPLAYLIVRLLADNSRRKWILAPFPLIVCGGALVLFDSWLWMTVGFPVRSQEMEMAIVLSSPAIAMLSICMNLVTVLLYVGLFSLPLLLMTSRPIAAAGAPSSLRRVPYVTAVGAVVLAIVTMTARHRIMPLVGNILIPQGVGPLTLRDTYILGLQNVPSLPSFFWVAVTLLSVWGVFELTERVAAFLVDLILMLRHRRFELGEASSLFAATVVLAYFAPLMLIRVYDRYLIPVLPLTLFFLASVSQAGPIGRCRVMTAAALCLLTAVFAVLAAHDYMAWNRARWAAIADLQKAGSAGPANLDGGFEYNGLFSYDRSYQKRDDKSWWWVNDDAYQIAFGPIDAIHIIGSYPYETLLPPAKRAILILHK